MSVTIVDIFGTNIGASKTSGNDDGVGATFVFLQFQEYVDACQYRQTSKLNYH